MKIKNDGFYNDDNRILRTACRRVSLMIALPIMIFPSLYNLFNKPDYNQFFISSLPFFLVACLIVLILPRWLFRISTRSKTKGEDGHQENK